MTMMRENMNASMTGVTAMTGTTDMPSIMDITERRKNQ